MSRAKDACDRLVSSRFVSSVSSSTSAFVEVDDEEYIGQGVKEVSYLAGAASRSMRV